MRRLAYALALLAFTVGVPLAAVGAVSGLVGVDPWTAIAAYGVVVLGGVALWFRRATRRATHA